MAAPVQFSCYDGGGVPLTALTPTFVQYVDKSGNARSQPVINNIGGGMYEFNPTDSDESTGTCYLVDCTATTVPRYTYGQINTDNNPFALFCVFDFFGALSAGAPTVGRYVDLTGVARSSPTVTAVSGIAYFYTITPSIADVAIGVAFRMDAFAGTIPAYLSGTFGTGSSTACGNITLLEIRNRCKMESDNVGQTFISDFEWDEYIRGSYRELYGLITQAFGNDYFVQTPAAGYTFVTDGVSQYFPLPTEFFKLLGVDLQISSPNYWVALKPFAFADRNRLSISNNPTPQAGQTIRVFYVPRLCPPTVDGDYVDGVNGWEEYIVIDAVIKAWLKEETDVTVFLAKKQAIIDRLNSEIENRDAGASAKIVDTLGRRARAMQYRINGNNLWLIGNGMPGYGYGDWGENDYMGW